MYKTHCGRKIRPEHITTASLSCTIITVLSPSLPPLYGIVSLPRLVDFDWRVDMKAASDSVNRMTQPTCLVQLKV